MKARLTRQDAVFRLADLDAGWAQSRLTGQLAYDPSAQRPTVTGDLHSPFLDVAALEPVFAGGPSSGKQDSSSGNGSGPAALAAYDADLKLAADRVRLPQAELRDVAAGVKLAAGHLTLDPLRVGLPQGAVQGRVEAADLTKSPLETAVDLTAQGIDLAGVPGLAGQDLAGRFEGTLTGTLRGTDLATLLAQSEAALKGRLDGARYAKVSLRQGDLEARLGQGKLTVDPLRVELPQGRLTGSLTTGPLAPMLDAKALDAAVKLDAQGVDLAPFATAGDLRPGRFTGSLNGSLRGGSLDAILGQSDLTLDGRLEGTRYGDAVFRQAATKAHLTGGKLALDPVQVALQQGGQVTGKVTTGPLAAMIDRKAVDAAVDLRAEGFDLAPFLEGQGVKGSDLGGILSGTLTGTLKGGQANEILGQSALRFAGRLDKPMLPRIGDKLDPVALDFALQPGTDRPIRATAESRLAGQPLKVEARAGAFASFFAGKGAYPLAVDASLGDTKASADGSVSLPLASDKAEFALKLSGQDPGPVLAKLDMPSVELPPYTLAGNLARRGTTYDLTAINGKVGDSDIAGRLTVKLDGPRPAVSGDLHSKTLDINDLGGMVGATPGTGPGETASPGQQAKAEAKKQQGEVVPTDPLDPQRWRQLDADVRLTADQVKAGSIPLDGFELRTALKDGLLRVDPMTLRLGEGSTTGWAQLDARQAPAKASLDVDLRALPVARLLERLHLNTSQLGTLSGRARGGVGLSGQGYSVKDFLANGDGEVSLLMQGGTINRELVTGLGFDFLQLFATFLGAVPDQVQLACAIADLQLQNGIMTTKSLALDTAVATIGGQGDVNFKNNAIDISLVADPKGVAVPSGRTGISVGGTLADPKVSVNPALLAARGIAGATLGVFLSPLTQLASKLGLGQAAQNGPCAASPAKPQEQGQGQGAAQGPADQLGKAIGQGLDLLGNKHRQR